MVPLYEYRLRKYLLLLATVVATVTYTVGVNPPGGVWQDTSDGADGHLAGDPIIRATSYRRYMVFLYCNTIAFASSLAVIFLVPLLASGDENKTVWTRILSLQVVLVLNLFSFIGAFAAWTCRDKLMTVYFLLLMAAAIIYILVQMVLGSKSKPEEVEDGRVIQEEERLRKVLMLLAMFAVSVTYAAALNTPGGFWDNTDGGRHQPGDTTLSDHHKARLTAFSVCNTTSFVASLLIIMLLLAQRRLRKKTVRSRELYWFITIGLMGLVGAYAAGSCRVPQTTVYVVGMFGAVLAYIGFQVTVIEAIHASLSRWLQSRTAQDPWAEQRDLDRQADSSFVVMLATLAATVTFQAGLDPPGGVWQDNGDDARRSAGDPILLATNTRQYKSFYLCNSIAFVASLVSIILVQQKLTHKHHMLLKAAMMLDLFGLIGAYAAGSCRDLNTSIYVIGLAIAVLVYVVIHIYFFTTTGTAIWALVEKRRKRLLLFAVLAATITYQAGLTPPGGFLQDDDSYGHRAGDPVLLYNFPRRYKAFFYCNSLGFMISIALIILLLNPRLYILAIQTNALSVCTAAGLLALMGAYAAGSTQHLGTSFRIIALLALVLLVLILLFLLLLFKRMMNSTGREPVAGNTNPDLSREEEDEEEESKRMNHSNRKNMMLLGILVASVTYQAGLDPPGGIWQSTGDGHDAGNPVMRDNRRRRYFAFFYCNSASFVASIVVVILLLPRSLQKKSQWLRWMNATIVLDLLGLLVAYAAGSCWEWRTSVYVLAPFIAVLVYVVIRVMIPNPVHPNPRQEIQPPSQPP